MKFRTKVLAMITGASLLVTATIFGTWAYLTDKSDEATNTFTSGKVQIVLDETKVNRKGEPLTGNKAGRRIWNDYTIVPGHTYLKDPVVKVRKDSQPAFVRVKVVFTNYNQLTAAHTNFGVPLDNPITLLKDFGQGWTLVKHQGKDGVVGDNGTTITYEYRYNSIVNAEKNRVTLPAVFQHLEIPTALNDNGVAALNHVKIKVTAYAIQAETFDKNHPTLKEQADAAWSAYDAQENH